ncbi:MAG: alpha/beta hydrolase [Anaerolineales bacterium]|jgi:pimeloyl-ACP methyl ester carboxylesterase
MKRKAMALLITVACILLLCLIVPLLIPLPPLEDTVPPQELADADSRFIEIDGMQFHYKILGQGEPAIVLLHGFVSSVFTWRKVMPPLSEYGTVIAFDRPGFGLTERLLPDQWEAESPYSAEAHADQTIALIEALGFEDAVLIGNSAGGSVALDAARRYPESVRALVLVDAAVYIQPGPPQWVLPLLSSPQGRRLGILLARGIAKHGKPLLDLALHDSSGIASEMWEGYTKPTHAVDWDTAFWELFLTTNPPHLEDCLEQVTIPVLVVSGDDDRVVPLEQSIRLADELPQATLAIFEQCGHLPQEECPEAFLDAVINFLNDLP